MKAKNVLIFCLSPLGAWCADLAPSSAGEVFNADPFVFAQEWRQHYGPDDARGLYLLSYTVRVKKLSDAWQADPAGLSLYDYLIKHDPKWKELSLQWKTPVDEKFPDFAARYSSALSLPFGLLRPMPADKEMIEAFHQHKTAFDELLQMVQHDSDFKEYEPNSLAHPQTPRGITEERLARYRALFEEAGLEEDAGLNGGFRQTDDRIELIAAKRGAFLRPGFGSIKGYVWFKKPSELSRKELVDDLDIFKESIKSGDMGTAYRHLDGNWYLSMTVEK